MSVATEGEIVQAKSLPPPRKPKPLRRAVLWGWVAGIVLAGGGNWLYLLAGSNCHTVLPGRVYRCAQPTGEQLASLIQRYGIRTVINLRGCCPTFPWYQEEAQVTHRYHVSQEDFSLSAARLPSIDDLRRLLEVLDTCEYPILIHCRQGADRTGVAAAMFELLQPGSSLEDGRQQLSLRYGHFRIGKTANLDRFLDLYEDWLQEQQLAHAPAVFRRWVREDYCPVGYRAELILLESLQDVPARRPFGIRIHVQNTSIRSWRLRAGTGVGIHVFFVLYDDEERELFLSEAGLFDAEVAPGQGLDLTLALPSLEPGAYRLLVDMADGQRCRFVQVGSEPLELEFVVRDQEITAGSRPGFTGLAGLADRLGPGR